jgi:hypothetical protein
VCISDVWCFDTLTHTRAPCGGGSCCERPALHIAGVDVNFADASTLSALDYACLNADATMVRWLLSIDGAVVDRVGPDGMAAIHRALW